MLRRDALDGDALGDALQTHLDLQDSVYNGGRRISIEQEVARESRRMATFLDAPTDCLPLWEPNPMHDDIIAWTDDDLNRLKALQIPASTYSPAPDLGLYSLGRLENLDPLFPTTLQDFTRGSDNIFVSNATGTGKTRLLAETLTRHWGFYFTCSAGTFSLNEYGSSDLEDAVSLLGLRSFDSSGLHPRITLAKRMTAASLQELYHNQTTARRPFLWVLLSRLLLFNEFCALYEARGIPEALARRKWLLLQLRPKGVTGVDSFYNLSAAVRDISDEDVLARIASAMHACQDRITFVAIDEAQRAQTLFETSFATTDLTRPQHAPLLRELIKCFAEYLPQKRFVISSHRLDLPLVSEALSAAHTRSSDVRHFYALGSFETIAQASAYIRHFVPEVSDDDCRLVLAWTRGRYRFLALVVMYTLMFGARNSASIVHATLFVLGDYEHPGSVRLRDQYHDDFQLAQSLPLLRYKTLDESDDRVKMALRKAAIDYATSGALHPINERDRVFIVSINAGFFDNDTAVRVFEPLVVLRLAHWLQTSKVAGIHGVIRRKLEDNNFSLTDAAFYDGFAALVWETSSSGTLDRWLDFPGVRPSWTQHGASLILPRFRQRRQPFAAYNRDSRSGSLLGFANSSDDVFTWLNNASQPFLIPDEGFGAELLFMLNLPNGNQVLVTVHTHFSDWERKRRDLRVVPVRPDELYKNSPEDNQRLMNILSKLPPLPIGSRKRVRASDTPKDRYARLPLLRLLCFAEPWRVGEAYDPPVASVNFRHLLELPAPVEIRLGDLERTILESV